MADIIIQLPPRVIARLRAIGHQQLTPEDSRKFNALLDKAALHPLTAELNIQLKAFLQKIIWEPEIGVSPEWAEALVECDGAFLDRVLRQMCRENDLRVSGDKKTKCLRLYLNGVEAVVKIMQPIIDKNKIQWREV